jgi:hypothetical protein
MKINTIGLDLAKSTLQAHGIDAAGLRLGLASQRGEASGCSPLDEVVI